MYKLSAPAEAIQETNTGNITVSVSGRPSLEPIPITLLSGNRWLVSPYFKAKKLEDDCGVDEKMSFDEIPAGWTELWRPGNDLDIEPLLGDQPGVVYMRHTINSPDESEAIVGVSNNSRMRIWLNGDYLHETMDVTHVRPSQGVAGGDGSNYAECRLRKGWNDVLIKLERGKDLLDVHFVVAGIDKAHPINVGHALLGLDRTKLSHR